MLAGAPVVYDKGESIRDLLIQDLRTRGVLSIHAEAAVALPAGSDPQVDHVACWISDHGGLSAQYLLSPSSLVDKLTPEGRVPTAEEMQRAV